MPGLAMGGGAFGSTGGLGGTFAPEFGTDPPAGDGAPPKSGGTGGQGGTGGSCTSEPSGVQAHLGGGGGGGYAGGGGGCLQGGGGGSSFVHPTLGTQLAESATNSGAGRVTIQWM
ncbi:MAG: hypothetical protein M3O50_06365 [Myxococcota bacterium]|nr:hypothetical protein [Myxococcota bacterium]